ncbi:OmpA family protein [Roseivirga sp. BDSF3-8]|uniref:OmpA family protein n=1 Tax=Roseivirga sp. BDSF3-8 TaxID=3241598 RepID=UPI00353223D6
MIITRFITFSNPALRRLAVFILGSTGLLLSIGCIIPAQAQRNFKGQKLDHAETTESARFYEAFSFPNVNRVEYYQDEGKLKQINELERKKDFENLYPVLKSYVMNFGIANFSRDTEMLWRLAKLTELFGDMEEAKAWYRLVLRHHRSDLDIKSIELYYDSLTVNDKQYYVPLDYYYELVEFRKSVDTLRPPRGILLNIGDAVNSGASDYGPTLSIDNNTLLFTSKRNGATEGLRAIVNEDLFYSKKYGDWQKASAFNEINTRYNEGSAIISRDGRTMYFARCHSPEGYGNCDLYSAKLQADSTWGEVKNMGREINSSGWDSHPSLTHSGDTLYFASDRIGGFGVSDIYYTHRRRDGSWSPAKNAGPMINSRQNEASPFYHPEYNILYFSSTGQLLNFGEFDIYRAYYRDGQFTEPVNIGPLVNGQGSELYFTIDSDSRELFYAKGNEGSMENLDLFSFPLPMGAQPEANTTFSGSLTDSLSGEPLTGIVSVIDLDQGIEVAPRFLRPDGSFQFDLIRNKNYLLIIQGDDYFRIEEIFYLEEDTDINLKATPLSTRMKFASIEFENGKADLLPAMFADLDRVIDFLLDNPDFRLKISGHTDSDGSEDLNRKLSQERADAIRDYIIRFGQIDPERIEAIGYGSEKPIVEETTEENKRLNRRVEFEIYRPAEENE